jgi:hypothetical protein
MVMSFSEDGIENLASFELGFSVQFIRVSPFDSLTLVVANRDGVFSHLDVKSGTYTQGGLALNIKGLVDVGFHPFMLGSVCFVFEYQVLLLFRQSNTVIPIHPNVNPTEALIAAYFPDPEFPQSTLLAYRSHARFIRVQPHGAGVQTIKYLTATRKSVNHVRCGAFMHGRLYVAGWGGSLQVFVLRGGNFWGMHLLRGAPSTVTDFAASGPKPVFGCRTGVVVGYEQRDRYGGWPPDTFYEFFRTGISQVAEVSDGLFVIVTHDGGRNRTFFWNVGRKKLDSMFTNALAALEAASVQISVAREQQMIATLIDYATLALFRVQGGGAKLIKVEYLDTQGRAIGCFSTDGTEYWTVDREFSVHKFTVSPQTGDFLYLSRIVQMAPGRKIGGPSVCAPIRGSFLIGTETGHLLLCAWTGAAPAVVEVSKKPLQSLSLSPDEESAIICDADSVVTSFDLKTLAIARCPAKSHLVRFVAPGFVLDAAGRELNYRQFPSYHVFDPPVPAALADHIALQSTAVRRQHFIKRLATPHSAQELARIARLHQFVFLGDLFESLDDRRFVAVSQGASLSRAAMTRYLETEEMFTRQEEGEDVRLRQVRVALMLGNSEKAVTLLMSGPATGPTYVLDLVKAALVDAPGVGNTMLVSVAALVSVGKIDDAVDILMLTKQVKHAAKVLLNEGRYHTAFKIMRAVLEEDEMEELMDEIEQAAMGTGGVRMIAAIVAFKRFDLAARLFTASGREFEAAVFSALEIRNGLFVLADKMASEQ